MKLWLPQGLRLREGLKNADEDIELAKRKAADEMKNSISEMVIGIAEQVVEKEIDTDAHSALIDEAIDGLGDMYEK